MAVYRVGADGSWRKSIENSDKYINFQTEWVDSYLTINDYYDDEYQEEIYTVLRTQTEYLAKFIFFNKDDKKEFRRLIEIAYQIEDKPSSKLSLWYHLRSFPSILKGITSVLTLLKKMKNEA